MGNILLIWLIRLSGLYLLLGFLFGLAFVSHGMGKVDPVAKEGTLGFRILILPGVIALWPFLLVRWLGGKRQPPQEVNAHRIAAAADSQRKGS